MIEIKHKGTGRVLRSFKRKTLIRVNLSGADLRDAMLHLAQLGLADLSHADLSRAHLSNADLRGANLIGANLTGASLRFVKLMDANLGGANLHNAHLRWADLRSANLRSADLEGADLSHADLSGAHLSGADLTKTSVGGTLFAHCGSLHEAKGLESVKHYAPSSLDRRTLQACIHKLPDVFLEGCGYTRLEIETLRALYTDSPIRFFSCFISHGEPDLPFAERLLADLRQNNVTCWHYKEDMRGGTDWDEQVNRAIKLYDKLILICSHSAVYRTNVVREILQAIHAEREAGEQKLFPIRLDDHILSTDMLDDELRHVKADLWPGVWVEEVKRKHIPDFSGWNRDHTKYQKDFTKFLAALQKVAPT